MARVTGECAVVIGASVAGLLAARVLSEHFDRVIILDRDTLPSNGEARRTVPQGQHLHGLLAGGLRAFEALFPGFSEGAQRRGALSVDIGSFGTWFIDGVRVPEVKTGLDGLLMSRPALEHHLRTLLCARDNIELEYDVRVRGLLGSAWRVTGVELEQDGKTRELCADMVVDASGRGSQLSKWLTQFGLTPPPEERVQMELTYTSLVVRRRRHHLGGKLGYVWAPTPPSLRAGAALALEDDRFIVTLMGYLGERAPRTYEGMVDYARSLPVPGLYELLRDAEPVGEPVQMHDPASVRRRYERLKHLPQGLLAIGDALCSINPSYGHGMTLAALEALSLARVLDRGDRNLARDFFATAAQVIDVPWAMVVGADFEFAGVKSNSEPPPATIRTYFKRALRAAQVDRDVALAVYRVMHLVEAPSALFAPNIMASVMAHEDRAPRASLMLVPEP